MTWDNDLLTDSNKAADFRDPDRYYETIGCSKTSCEEYTKKAVKRARKKCRNVSIKCHPDKSQNKYEHAKYERTSSKHAKCVRVNE